MRGNNKSKIENCIPRIYQRQAITLLMYAFVRGARWALHSLTIKEAAEAFIEQFGISPEDYSLDSVMVIYQRTHKEFIEDAKTKV